MIVDILMAFVIAMILELFSFHSNTLKQILISVVFIECVVVYFICGQINFVGEIDFEIWIMFVTIFNIVITNVMDRLEKHMK